MNIHFDLYEHRTTNFFIKQKYCKDHIFLSLSFISMSYVSLLLYFFFTCLFDSIQDIYTKCTTVKYIVCNITGRLHETLKRKKEEKKSM